VNTLGLAELRRAYAEGSTDPNQVFAEIIERAQATAADHIWIEPPSRARLRPYLEALDKLDPEQAPLWGIPFAVKDNIDVAGWQTTAGCPAYVYTPSSSATVVELLVNAGAVPVGKTNLDQFATGLVGTRSPYGACSNSLDRNYISGGSSSGSAAAVAKGLATFSLGTDTAGSGRVPAALNELVGIKPSRGMLSLSGVVPACYGLDCVSVFAADVATAVEIMPVLAQYDDADPMARKNPHTNDWQHYGAWQGPLRLGILPSAALEFFGDDGFAAAYQLTIDKLAKAGVQLLEIDFEPFRAAAVQLYEGPWVSARYHAISDILERQPEAILPITRSIIEPGAQHTAVQLLNSQYELAALRRAAINQLAGIDCLLTPTVGRTYTQDQVKQDPLTTNNNLGYYTNFMNLLDLCGLAMPACRTQQGLPFGITLVADAWQDCRLAAIATYLQKVFSDAVNESAAERVYSDPAFIDIAVCGAHMSGLPLNHQLTERGGVALRQCRTSTSYHLYALPGGPPRRPGLVRADAGGTAIDLEVWRLPSDTFTSFVAGIPAPLGIGRIELEDGQSVCGFVCETSGTKGAENISHFGGWRTYLNR